MLSNEPIQMAFIGLHGVYPTDGGDVALDDRYSLVTPNRFLLSARSEFTMNRLQYDEAEKVTRYLVYRGARGVPSRNGQEVTEALQNGLMAFQIVKPIRTTGLIFYGFDSGSDEFVLQRTEYRFPTDAGEWARMRKFDDALLVRVPTLIKSIETVMKGESAEQKNAVFFLQMGLEHNNPMIAGLLWAMGIDAILGGEGRAEFAKRLCTSLGPKTAAFPDWNEAIAPPPYLVEDVALDLYVLRNKLGHGVDLRKAAKDKSTPVDLMKRVKLTELSDPTSYSMVLSQAACYLLCQLLEKGL